MAIEDLASSLTAVSQYSIPRDSLHEFAFHVLNASCTTVTNTALKTAVQLVLGKANLVSWNDWDDVLIWYLFEREVWWWTCFCVMCAFPQVLVRPAPTSEESRPVELHSKRDSLVLTVHSTWWVWPVSPRLLWGYGGKFMGLCIIISGMVCCSIDISLTSRSLDIQYMFCLMCIFTWVSGWSWHLYLV